MSESRESEKNTALHWLVNSLNRHADNGVYEIKKSILSKHLSYGYKDLYSNDSIIHKLSWEDITCRLDEWEAKGWIEQIANVITAGDQDVCLIMKKYIGGSVWEGGSNLPS